MTLLTTQSLAGLRDRAVRVPAYDRARLQTGFVHFGAGAFHRAHQAFHLDTALERDPRWGICDVSLHSTAVRDALVPQDCLYSLAVLDAQPSLRVIGSIREILVAPESPGAVLARMVDPAVHFVTATITEKGYCLSADGGLNFAHPDIEHDLRHPDQPRTFVGYLVAALARRQARQIPAPNIMSCDNLSDNGHRLRRAVVEFAREQRPDCARWIEAEVTFPCTMVDSITPATDDALRTRVAQQLGVVDQWPVQREWFSQWVIEDVLRGPQPDWAAAGVTVTNDVAGYERAKLRLLNGAHSSLAYLGSLAGYETVSQAMSEPVFAVFLRSLMLQDILPAVAAPRGLDLPQYVDAILARFVNPAIRHLLSQIVWDGSQKLPFRLLGTVGDNLAAGRPIARLCLPIAAWLHFVRRKALRGERVIDPLAEKLFDIASACTGEQTHDVPLFLTLESVFPPLLAASAQFIASMVEAYARLANVDDPLRLRVALSAT